MRWSTRVAIMLLVSGIVAACVFVRATAVIEMPRVDSTKAKDTLVKGP